MKAINREELKNKLDQEEDLALIEVLAAEQYDAFHLPGAVNVPVNEGFETRVQEAAPDKSAPVVVYCLDEDCEASEQAARRLEELGYKEVYDYAPGKLDWKQAGLPVEN